MLRSGLYNGIGAIFRLGLSLITAPLFIRLLGLDEYGLWTLIWASIGFLGLGEAGFSVSSTVFVAKDVANKDNKQLSETLTIILGVSLFLATLVSVLMWLGAGLVPVLFPNLTPTQSTTAVQAFQLGAILLWSRLLQQVLSGIIQAFQAYGTLNIVSSINSVASNLALLGIAFWGGRVVPLMIGQLVIGLGTLMVYLYVVRKLAQPFQPHLAWSRQRSFVIIRYSLLTWVSLLGGTLFTQCDRLLVGALLNTRLLGVYGAITSITTQINSISAVWVQPILPTISNLTANQEIDYILVQQKVRRAVYVNGIVALGLGISLFTFAPVILSLIIPNLSAIDYTLYLTDFRIAIIIYTAYSTNAVGYFILFGINSVSINTVLSLISGILSLILIGLGIINYGLLGAVSGNIVYVITWLANYYSFRKLHIQMRLWFDWLQFPLIWAVGTVAIAAVLARSIEAALIIGFIQSVVFGSWLIIRERNHFQLVFRVLRKDKGL